MTLLSTQKRGTIKPTLNSHLSTSSNTYLDSIRIGAHFNLAHHLAADPNLSQHGSRSCRIHPNRRTTFVCIGKGCTYNVFCESCSLAHSESCLFKEVFNIDMLLDPDQQRASFKDLKTHQMLLQISKNIDQQLGKILSGSAESFQQIKNIFFETDQKSPPDRILRVLEDWAQTLMGEYSGIQFIRFIIMCLIQRYLSVEFLEKAHLYTLSI